MEFLPKIQKNSKSFTLHSKTSLCSLKLNVHRAECAQRPWFEFSLKKSRKINIFCQAELCFVSLEFFSPFLSCAGDHFGSFFGHQKFLSNRCNHHQNQISATEQSVRQRLISFLWLLPIPMKSMGLTKKPCPRPEYNLCYAVLSCSVMSDSWQPHGLQPARLLCPWGLSKQEYWSVLPCPPPGDLPQIGIKPRSSACRQILYHLNHQGSPRIQPITF